jgi:hypothetical protein
MRKRVWLKVRQVSSICDDVQMDELSFSSNGFSAGR